MEEVTAASLTTNDMDTVESKKLNEDLNEEMNDVHKMFDKEPLYERCLPCEFAGCLSTDLDNPIRFLVYNPRVVEKEIYLCSRHKTYVNAMFTEYKEATDVIWNFFGHNATSRWSMDNLVLYHNSTIKMCETVLKLTRICLHKIMDCYNDFSVPNELICEGIIIEANIALCNYVVKERLARAEYNKF